MLSFTAPSNMAAMVGHDSLEKRQKTPKLCNTITDIISNHKQEARRP